MRRPILSLAVVAAALALSAERAAAQQPERKEQKVSKEGAAAPQHGTAHGAGHGAGHGGDHAASGWKEMDAFHQLMMQTWHPASATNDLAPIRAKAGAMADAARAWGAAAVPKACDTPETRSTVARLATESRALADLVARPGAADAEVKGALKALHDRFEHVEHGCQPGHPAGHR